MVEIGESAFYAATNLAGTLKVWALPSNWYLRLFANTKLTYLEATSLVEMNAFSSDTDLAGLLKRWALPSNAS